MFRPGDAGLCSGLMGVGPAGRGTGRGAGRSGRGRRHGRRGHPADLCGPGRGRQYAEAQAAADAAKKWVKWSVIAAVVSAVLYGIVLAIIAMTADTSTPAALAAML